MERNGEASKKSDGLLRVAIFGVLSGLVLTLESPETEGGSALVVA